MGCRLSGDCCGGVIMADMCDGYPYVTVSSPVSDGPNAGDIVQRIGESRLVHIGDGSSTLWDMTKTTATAWANVTRFRRLRPPEMIEIT